MASSITGGAGNDLVLPDSEVTNVVIDVTEDAALFEVQEAVVDINIAVGGDVPVKVEGEAVKKSVIRPVAAEGETAKITLETTKVAKTTIVSEGEGSVEVNVGDANFKKSTIDLSNSTAKDSISFSGSSQVTKSTILLGDGKDTVTFDEGVKLKGNTKIKVGSGVDSIEVPEEVGGKGKIFISNFSKRDKLFVDGEKLRGKRILSGKKEVPDFIAVQFETGEEFGV